MLVRIDEDSHVNFYEGDHIGIHSEDGKKVVVVEHNNGLSSVTYEAGVGAKIFVMDEHRKTVDRFFVKKVTNE